METGQKIRKLREELGMTLEEVGDKVGVGKSTVRKWENGIIANMRRDKIAKLADVLNCSPGYLLGYEEDRSESGFEPESAHLVSKIRDDKALLDALCKYFNLSEEKKKHVIDLINLLASE